jgi:hypothetical protein
MLNILILKISIFFDQTRFLTASQLASSKKIGKARFSKCSRILIDFMQFSTEMFLKNDQDLQHFDIQGPNIF